MKFSVDSRSWLWTGLLLLAALCTVIADDPASVAPGILVTSTEKASLVNTTTPSPKEQGNTTGNGTAPVPVGTTSSVTSPKPATSPATSPAPTTHPTTPTTQAPATKVSTTTVTSKETVTTKTTNATATSSSPVTSSISATLQQKSGFDLGSFIGGIVLTIGLLAAVYFGCRFYNSRRGVRYRTIDEHEAII
ncbi:porimin [Hyla sarda]|uniref:porimin n=1 Tax=Hyla sarda TaxID=327740 RepID=UPI0024C46E4F|nr:porimin [Hyla sarda]